MSPSSCKVWNYSYIWPFPPNILNQEDLRLDLQMFGITLSAIVYGTGAMFMFDFFPLLRKTKRTLSKRMQFCLAGFLIGMLLLSSVAIIQGSICLASADHYLAEITYSSRTAFSPWKFLLDFGLPGSLPLIFFGANVFMVWRCLTFSKNLASSHRAWLFCVLSMLALSSLAGAVLFYLQGILPRLGSKYEQEPSIPLISSIANILLGLLITFLILNTKKTGTVTSSEGLWYGKAANICIDSCFLIPLINAVHIFLSFLTRNGAVITLQILPHICVLSMTLALERFVKDRVAAVAPVDVQQTHLPQNRELSLGIHSNTLHAPSSPTSPTTRGGQMA
ncbi:hypothetical protein GALMADRAFT_282323 [Galerina marginata CBS 339.88]|uniref:Uncharacterized protein n=1 Tax=Galerina marginata (strain CBS 339.88) TaxID=685588 RepID=A0A067STZ5_GALM3|nr:hypothetical protein GALMADRAFT_282323 [Galerina marginata CBS 339.88]